MLKTIQGFDYKIDECGNIFNKHGREMKQQTNRDGYKVINLWTNGKYIHCRVNRLVAEAFIPNPENKPIVNHINHIREDNRVVNLEWVTEKENVEKSIEHHGDNRKWGHSDIDRNTAEKICQMIQDGARNIDIANKLNVSVDVIKHIRRGNTWKEVSCQYKLQSFKKSISETTARWICNKIKEGYANREIVEMSKNDKVTKTLVKAIRGKRTWIWLSEEYF